MMALTTDTLPIDDFEFGELDGFPTVDECLWRLFGVRPGVSSPRRSVVNGHRPVGWLYAVRG